MDPRNGLGLIARMFGNALARRVAYVVVAFALAGLGVGSARAGGTCPSYAVYSPPSMTLQDEGEALALCRSTAKTPANLGGYMRDFIGCEITSGTIYKQKYKIQSCEANNQGLETFFGSFSYNGTCAGRNATLGPGPRVYVGAAPSCANGCAMSHGGITKTTVNGSSMVSTNYTQYTGLTCVRLAPPNGIDNTPAPSEDKEACTPLGGGQTACKKATTGEYCATASNGVQKCWQPNETGEKTAAADALQRRSLGDSRPVTAPITPPPPDTNWKPTDSHTERTGTQTTTITNYTTTTNTSATDSGHTGADGGSSAGGGGDSDQGDGTSASGGGDCETPPIVQGDAALGMVATQAWATRCAVEAGNAVKVTGDVGNCATPYTVEGNDANAEKLRAMRAEICGEAISDLDNLDQTDGLDGINVGDVIKEYVPGTGEGVGDLDAAGFGWGASCPQPPEIFGVTMDLVDFCNVMTAIGALIAAMGALHAFYIIRGNT